MADSKYETSILIIKKSYLLTRVIQRESINWDKSCGHNKCYFGRHENMCTIGWNNFLMRILIFNRRGDTMRNLIVKYHETLLFRDISEKYFTPVHEIKDSLLERISMHFVVWLDII